MIGGDRAVGERDLHAPARVYGLQVRAARRDQHALAAALTTLRVLRESDGIATMRASGSRLQEGLVAQASAHGLEVSVTGPPQMPLLLFADDPEFERTRAWAQACVRHGVYLHPIHNWFLSAAHDAATIDAALARTDEAFREIRDAFGAD